MAQTINRHIIKEIVKESLLNYLCERIDKSAFGKSGPIPLKPANTLCGDVPPNVLQMVDSGSRSINTNRLGDPEFFGNTLIWKIYLQYKAMIERKKEDLGRTAVGFFTFLKKVRSGWLGEDLVYFQTGDDYLLGVKTNGVFIIAYAAPSTLRNLYSLVQASLNYNDVVYSVTDDMAAMLDKLGVPKYPQPVACRFRGRDCEKIVFGSTENAVRRGVELLGGMHMMRQSNINADQLNMNEIIPRFTQMLTLNPFRALAVMGLIAQKEREVGHKLDINNPMSLKDSLKPSDMIQLLSMFSESEKQYILTGQGGPKTKANPNPKTKTSKKK